MPGPDVNRTVQHLLHDRPPATSVKHVLKPDARRLIARWLLLLVQLPAAPSSARVAIWRRLRAVGAASLQNGAWVLPPSAERAALLDALAAAARRSGGTAVVFEVRAPSPETNDAIVEQFRGDRALEYAEFGDRCAELLRENTKETERAKFTFAELEEIEDDLAKQARWLDKIKARDFFPNAGAQAAAALLARCRDVLAVFAQAVYRREGVEAPAREPAASKRSRARPATVGSKAAGGTNQRRRDSDGRAAS